MSGIKVSGMDKLTKDLESRLGKARMQPIIDSALKAGAEVFVKELQSQVSTFSDKTGFSEGYTLEEITISEPYTQAGVRTIKVQWKGPHGRYRIIHLNEFGTVKNPNPRGKGAIARTLNNSRKAYRKALADKIRGAF